MKRFLAILLALLLTAPSALAATTGERNALNKAHSYLSFMAFSKEGLIEQLEFEGYTKSQATYAANFCGADWNEQAAKKAESYLSFMSFSYEGLVDQLEYEGFTEAQAQYGARVAYYGGSASAYSYGSSATSAGKTQALKKAKSYLSIMAFSHEGLVKQLAYEGFTKSEATYAADNCGANWNEQAAKKAKSYLSIMSFSRSELIKQLEYEGFTYSQASYGARMNGY